MPLWQWALDFVGVLLALVVVYGVLLIGKRRSLAQRGTFEMSYRFRSDRAGRGWLLGLGRYNGELLEWYRVFSLSLRPKRVWDRAQLEYTGRRTPEGSEDMSLYADHVVVTCSTVEEGDVEFAMSPASLMGFQSWLEAMPPGSRSVRPGDSPNAM